MSWVERAAIIRVFRCDCGKMHCCAGISQTTTCTCGQYLYRLMWMAGR